MVRLVAQLPMQMAMFRAQNAVQLTMGPYIHNSNPDGRNRRQAQRIDNTLSAERPERGRATVGSNHPEHALPRSPPRFQKSLRPLKWPPRLPSSVLMLKQSFSSYLSCGLFLSAISSTMPFSADSAGSETFVSKIFEYWPPRPVKNLAYLESNPSSLKQFPISPVYANMWPQWPDPNAFLICSGPRTSLRRAAEGDLPHALADGGALLWVAGLAVVGLPRVHQPAGRTRDLQSLFRFDLPVLPLPRHGPHG